MENPLFNNPTEDQDHPIAKESGSGKQKIYKYPNGYGASVVRFKLPNFTGALSGKNLYGSYTSNETEWELALIKHDKTGNFGIFYHKIVGDDVVGHLKEDDVEKYLKKIKALPKHNLI